MRSRQNDEGVWNGYDRRVQWSIPLYSVRQQDDRPESWFNMSRTHYYCNGPTSGRRYVYQLSACQCLRLEQQVL